MRIQQSSVSMVRVVSCSLTEPVPALSLVHLVHLEDFTLHGAAKDYLKGPLPNIVEDGMNDLLESTAVPFFFRQAFGRSACRTGRRSWNYCPGDPRTTVYVPDEHNAAAEGLVDLAVPVFLQWLEGC